MTYKNFTVETDADGIALVTWDMPGRSMNVFSEDVMLELDRIVDQVVADEAVKGVVITSGKESFSGGADLTMLKRLTSEFEKKAKKELAAWVRRYSEIRKLNHLVGGVYAVLSDNVQAPASLRKRA